jgi:hypothetical protein
LIKPLADPVADPEYILGTVVSGIHVHPERP